MTIHSGHDSTPRAVNLKDMPPAPTDETVVVPPPEHRDDKHNLHWYRKRGVQIGGAVTALVAAGLTVFALNNGPAEKTEPKSEPVASAPANPSESASPTVEVSPSVEASPLVEASSANDALVAELDGLSAKQFEKRPLQERVAWVAAKYKEINDNGYLWDFLDQTYDDGSSLSEYSPYYSPLTTASDGTAILRYNDYAEQIIKGQKLDITSQGNGEIDQEVAKKFISGYTLESNRAAYLSMEDTVDNSTRAGRLTEESIRDFKIVKQTAAKPTKNPEDNTNAYTKKITFMHSGTLVTDTYIFVPCPQMGEGNGIWLIADQTRL